MRILNNKSVKVMVFNGSFFNISVISWWPILLVEETGIPGTTTDLSQVTVKLYRKILYGVNLTMSGIRHSQL
jgi:hypothetical protein